MKTLLLSLFFTASGFSLCSQQLSNNPVDVRHYVFTLELSDSTDAISGKADVTVRFISLSNRFELDLMNKHAGGKGMQIKGVTAKGYTVTYKHDHNKIAISLNNTIPPGKEVTISISYFGVPEDGLIISSNKYGDRTFFGDNWPDRAHYWLPVVDHPSDKASVEFIVTAPLHYEVIGNGIKMEETFLSKKKKLTHWKEALELPTKVMVIGAARFAIQHAGEVNHIPVEQWVYPQNKEEGFRDYAAAVNILEFFIRHIGPYPYQKLVNVQSKTKYGGMENASNIFYSETSVNGKADHDNLLAHEIAHQWFGNSASEDNWHHVWLSEGFATYFTHIYNEYTYGVNQRQADMKRDREEVINYYLENPMPVVNTTITDLMKLLNTNSYQKGSWVLHMLRQEIGNENFWKGIREYYRQYQHSNALTADFRIVMEKVSGIDLNQFFNQWIFKAGHPVIKSSWNYDPQGKKLEITIQQAQKGSLFNFPLEIAVEEAGKDLPHIEKVRISQQTEKISISMGSQPSKIVLDPNINLLFEGN